MEFLKTALIIMTIVAAIVYVLRDGKISAAEQIAIEKLAAQIGINEKFTETMLDTINSSLS